MTALQYKLLLRIGISIGILIAVLIFVAQGIYGFFLLTFPIALLWQIGVRGESVCALGIKKKSLFSSFIVGALSGFALALIGMVLFRLLGIGGVSLEHSSGMPFSATIMGIEFSVRKEVGYALLSQSQTPQGFLLYFVYMIFVVGLGEEIFWRGLIQRKLMVRLPKQMTLWLTAFLFGVAHCYLFSVLPLFQAVSFIVIIGIVGALWGYLYEHYDNIFAPAVSHGIVALIVWKYLFFVFP